MLKRIQQAKESGLTLKLCYITVALTGSSAAGKTSFLNLLSRKKFTAQHHSTNVAESKQVVYTAGVVGSGRESQWIDLSHENMLEQLKDYLETHAPTVTLAYTEMKKYTTKCQTEDDIAAVNMYGRELLNPDNASSLGDVWKMVNFLDTGGQPEFINLFPAISSSIIVTFIVLNMCGGVKSLDEPVKVIHSKHGVQSYEPYHLHYTNLDLIKLLMAFSKDSCIKSKPPLLPIQQKSKSTSTSYQCYVGTHADKVTTAEIQAIESKLKCTANELKCNKLLWELNGKVLFPVDNTTAGDDNEDPIAGIIRTRIQGLVENSSIYDVPITWFILLLEMQKISSQGKRSFMPFSEVVDICKKGKLSQDEEEVQNALLLFHLMGVLLYYHEVPGMCQYVIINHQWLFEKLSSLTSFTFERKGYDLEAVEKFKNDGLLSKSLIEQIYLQADIKTDCFIALLEHLKVIAKVDTKNYFMPCILHSQSITPTILDQYGNLQHVQLLVHFVNNPLPQGFFCCLVVQICQNLPKNWLPPIQQKQHIYNNLITFHTSDTGHSISLIDKIGYLEIQIRHQEASTAIHYDVQQFLTNIFDEVCNHLQLDCKQLCYGFLCNCSNTVTSENHVVSVSKELDPIPHWIQCSYNKIKLTPSHLIWLQPPSKVSYLCSNLCDYIIINKRSVKHACTYFIIAYTDVFSVVLLLRIQAFQLHLQM